MKKRGTIFLLIICFALPPQKVEAQDFEIQQLLLNVEKLAQLKSMLEDLRKGYEIVYQGYTAVKNISEGNFSLHKAFLDRLLQVSPAVQQYYRVGDILQNSVGLVKEYKAALKGFSGNGLLLPQELARIEKVYEQLFKKSIDQLETLSMVLTSGALRMSDDERLAAIDRIDEELKEERMFLRHFTNGAKVLLLQRTKEERNGEVMKKIYGINK